MGYFFLKGRRCIFAACFSVLLISLLEEPKNIPSGAPSNGLPLAIPAVNPQSPITPVPTPAIAADGTAASTGTGTGTPADGPKNHKYPLQPPFQIVQVGEPRSGSTFQWHLLTVIAQLKSPANTKLASNDFFSDRKVLWETMLHTKSKNQTLVGKVHNSRIIDGQIGNHISTFTSGSQKSKLPDLSHYHQQRDNLLNCSLCEIDQYRPIFGLDDEEVVILKTYMRLWEKLRQCCGYQMSKYQRFILHGCEAEKYQSRPDYPWCERLNLTDIEFQFEENPIDSSWFNRPGDCAAHDLTIIGGKDFNGEEFKGCESFENQYILKK